MYKPTADLYDGIAQASPLELTPWDDYFPRMAETDFLAGRADQPAVKSYFVRRAPFNGAYILLGGITAFLRSLNEIRFDTPEFAEAMKDMGYCDAFIEHLKERKGFRNVHVYAPPEGTPFFPNEPIVTLTGPLVELRLADGLLISECNFASLSLTKWHRLVRAVRPGGALEFSRRRAQNQLKASLYGMLAGCVATSNAELRRSFDVLVRGTMGHEWMQSFPTLREAFDTWLEHQPHQPLGLIDTVRCMEEDFPTWLDAVYDHREAIKAANPAMWGWRNDSGDLAYLLIEQYVRFLQHPLAEDPWFKDRMRITLTNELDEYSSSAIIGQVTQQGRAAGLDAADILSRIIWAAGTRPGVCIDDPAIGGVMKLMESDGHPSIKLALDPDGSVGPKTSIPGFNLSGMICRGTEKMGILIYPEHRYTISSNGKLFDLSNNHEVAQLEAVHPDNPALTRTFDEYTIEPRQQIVYEGELTDAWKSNRPTIKSVQEYVMERTDELPWYCSRLDKPQLLPVSVTPDVFRLRAHMIKSQALQGDYTIF